MVGKLLFCHPNTVRYRLHRIEQRTGRSLSRPRDVAELCLAFEVHRRLRARCSVITRRRSHDVDAGDRLRACGFPESARVGLELQFREVFNRGRPSPVGKPPADSGRSSRRSTRRSPRATPPGSTSATDCARGNITAIQRRMNEDKAHRSGECRDLVGHSQLETRVAFARLVDHRRRRIPVPLRSRRGTSRLTSARSEVIAPGDSRRVLSVEGGNTMANLAHGEGGRDLADAMDERACRDP